MTKKTWFFDGYVKIDDKNEDLPINNGDFHCDVSPNQMVNHLTNTRSPGHPVAPQSKGQPKGQL